MKAKRALGDVRYKICHIFIFLFAHWHLVASERGHGLYRLFVWYSMTTVIFLWWDTNERCPEEGVQKQCSLQNKDDTASCSYQFFITCIMKAHRTSLIMGQNLTTLGITTQNRIIFSTSNSFRSRRPVFLQYHLKFWMARP